MNLYQRTNAAEAILSGGFRDGEGRYMTDQTWRGVWLSDRPLDANEGAWGRYLLEIVIPEEIVAPFEWVDDEGTYREFLIPAEIVNRYAPPGMADEDAFDSWPVCE